MLSKSLEGRFRWSLLAVGVVLLLTISACGDEAGEATPSPSPAAAEAVAATPTPQPEPTSTPTPEPTATPTMYVPAPTVAAPIHQPPAVPPTPVPDVEEEPEQATPVPDPTATLEPEGEPPPDPETDPELEEPVDDPVISHPLTGLAGWEIDYAQAIPVEDGLQIVNVASDGREIWEAAYMGEQLADVVAMLDVKDVGASYSGYACLAVRTAAQVWEYAYAVCLNGYGETFAEFKYIDVDGNYTSEFLAPAEVREGTRATTEWNTLVIAAVGQDFAFYINDTMIGTAIHPSIESGGISFGVGNFEEAPAQWVFAHLDVWDAR